LVKSLPSWRNLIIPVELITIKYHELSDYKIERSPEEARRLAEERALQEALASLSPNTRVEKQWVEEVQTGRAENLVRVKAIIEAVEDIGADKQFKP
jgi:similar to stage IV sporulation protein